MKKWPFVAAAVAAAGLVSVAGIIFQGQEPWTLHAGSGSGLVLSVKAFSPTMPQTTVEIRCNGGTAELRLYLPTNIRVLPPAGQPAGPLTLAIGEEFEDRDRKPIAVGNAAEPFDWVVADDRTYAFRTGAATLIERMIGQEWLRLNSLGFSGDNLVSSALMVPLRGLAEHKGRITSACRSSG